MVEIKTMPFGAVQIGERAFEQCGEIPCREDCAFALQRQRGGGVVMARMSGRRHFSDVPDGDYT